MYRVIRRIYWLHTSLLVLAAAWIVPAAHAQDAAAELKCVIAAYEKLNAYLVEKNYQGQLSYEGGDDPENFRIFMDVPPMGYSFPGTPEEQLNQLINIVFSDEERGVRFRPNCSLTD
ncbi:MAG: hypothetical protein WBO37_03735 [Gammaproteobacteria bacterium]